MYFNYKFIFFLISFFGIFQLLGCGTIYVPQILPEGRGVSKSEGQEEILINVLPLTLDVIKKANEDDYVRRVIDAGDLNSAARLISVNQAINEKIPKNNDPGPYKIGVGDILSISQILSVKDESGFTQKIAQRALSIADDGYASVLGIGRVPLAGLTQFEAEDRLYRRLVLSEVNPEFELFISEFKSKSIQVTNLLVNNKADEKDEIKDSNIFKFDYTNYPLYLSQVLSRAKVSLPEGEDALIKIIRVNNEFRLSLRSLVEGKYEKIRLFPEDQVIIKSVPYRPETAVIMGEVINPRLYNLSPSSRRTLSEALYSDQTFDPVSSDTSQIYLLRPKGKNTVTAYHLDASNPTRLILANKLELRPGDLIYVAPQPVSNYNRAFLQIFGAYAMTIDPASVND